MLKSHIKALLIVASLIWSGLACAVSFGSANVTSALGQPLKAEIALAAVSDADRSNLTAHLASPDAFKAAGLDYPYNLSKLRFDIVTHNGQTFIKISSKEAVNDPFVSLLVELTWSSGRLLHEYTFLLDPPDYKAEQPKPEEVTPIEPVVVAVPPLETPVVAPIDAGASAPVDAGASAPAATTEAVPQLTKSEAGAESSAADTTAPELTSAPASAVVATAVPETAAAPETSEAKSAPEPASQKPTHPTASAAPAVSNLPEVKETIVVKRGDTLSKIASRVQEPDVTLEQMLVALYRANANKFEGRNMNRIRVGKILQMPDQADIEKLSQAAAVREIRTQTANWNAYRQKLAAASTPVPEQAPKQEASGKVNTSVADKTPAVKESAKEKLVLSKGEAPGDKTAVRGKESAQEAQAHAKEEAIAKEKAAQENNARAAMLEKNKKDLEKLATIKGTAPAASSAAVASSVAAGSAVQPAKPKAVPVTAKPEPSMLDDLLDNPTLKEALDDPMYLGGGAAVLLGLGGLGFYLARRDRGGSGRAPKKKSLISKLMPKKK